jgi:hypothetical protein
MTGRPKRKRSALQWSALNSRSRGATGRTCGKPEGGTPHSGHQLNLDRERFAVDACEHLGVSLAIAHCSKVLGSVFCEGGIQQAGSAMVLPPSSDWSTLVVCGVGHRCSDHWVSRSCADVEVRIWGLGGADACLLATSCHPQRPRLRCAGAHTSCMSTPCGLEKDRTHSDAFCSVASTTDATGSHAAVTSFVSRRPCPPYRTSGSSCKDATHGSSPGRWLQGTTRTTSRQPMRQC